MAGKGSEKGSRAPGDDLKENYQKGQLEILKGVNKGNPWSLQKRGKVMAKIKLVCIYFI